MAKRKRGGNAYKEGYKKYKLENKRLKNKISRVKRHIKNYPEDLQAQESLDKIQKGEYCTRYKPKSVNPVKRSPFWKKLKTISGPKTAGEQLSLLLGIPLKKPKKSRSQAPIKYRKKRNVKKTATS